ncbi:MAG: hypothetical protein EA339_07355 [Rhodobacteraceae bacterium]|nr:MAG: hypothetical protein EA339_07355 [Paracoccaceae bacterium]
MVLSLGRQVSRLLGGHRLADPDAVMRLPRPFVWLHGDHAEQAHALVSLSDAVLHKEAGISVLLSLPPEAAVIVPDMPGRVVLPVGDDAAALALALVARKHLPAAVLLAARRLPVAMIRQMVRRKVAVFVLDAQGPGFAAGWRHLPGFSRAMLSQLSHVFVQHEAERALWLEQGLAAQKMTVCGRLSPTPAALGCNEAEREALSEAFRHRTMWLAVGIPEREEDAIIAAHREALRESHRLVLILHPADPGRGAALGAKMAAHFVTALRSRDDLVTPETQVYIVDTEGERGLWYRLAVCCYLGGSLGGEGAQISPMEPAGLGCAVVHGRHFGRHSEAFDLLRSARATRMVQSGEGLGGAICAALRPEQAADQAHRGWQVISTGYEATEAVLTALIAAARTREG